MSKGSLDVSKLITCKYSIEEFQDAYNLINQKNSMGVILEYEQIGDSKIQDTLVLNSKNPKRNVKNKPNRLFRWRQLCFKILIQHLKLMLICILYGY